MNVHTGTVLSVRGLSKRFGGLEVARSIDLDMQPGARMGLIGPNGAGKTTFVNLLTGALAADAGEVILAGHAIEREKATARVRRGLVRTHQINTLLRDMTVRENVALAIAERDGIAWRMLRYDAAWRRCLGEAGEQLRALGIADLGDRAVSAIAYGKQRLLEIAIALVMKPKVLLLDEPAAGVPSGETHAIHDALERLPANVAVLMIEHDMDLVFRFAQEIVVLVQGGVLTRGTPAEVGRDAKVKAVYLGRSAR